MKHLLLILLILALIPIASVAAQTTPCQKPITVWDNDTLSSLAQENNVQAADLAAKNGLTLASRLLIGDVLCLDGVATVEPAPIGGGTIPLQNNTLPPAVGTGGATNTTANQTATPPPTANPTTTPPPANNTAAQLPPVNPTTTQNFRRGQTTIPTGYTTYTVQANDTLFRIAQTNGVALTELARVNNIGNINIIYVGETLLIPPRTTTPPPVTQPPTGGQLPPAQPTQQPSTGVFTPAPGSIPVVTLGAPTARPGATLTVTGSNYPGNATVNIYIEKKSLGLISDALTTVTTAPNGTFTATITIPSKWKDGSAVNQTTVSVSAYTATGGYWAMNFFVNR